jgi:hypothetical protein
MTDYYYPPDEKAVFKYDVKVKPPPADTAKAEFHEHDATGDVFHTEQLKKQGAGNQLQWALTGVDIDRSPVVVIFTFEKSGKEPITLERRVSLARPGVKAISAPADVKAGEKAKVKVTKWAAIAYDSPGNPSPLEEKNPKRIAQAHKDKVKWKVGDVESDATGAAPELEIPEDLAGQTVNITGFLEDEMGGATTSIVVPKLEIKDEGGTDAPPDTLRERQKVTLSALVRPDVKGTWAWSVSGDAVTLKKNAKEPHKIGLEATKAGDVTLTVKLTSKATKTVYEATHDLTVEPAKLELVSVDANFAPSVETNDLKYDLLVPEDLKVVLEVRSEHYLTGKDNVVFRKELSADEKKDGVHTFAWDGKTTTKKGPLKDGRFIHPLFGPYKVRLFVDEKLKSEDKEFNVLYHSIELARGPWTGDEQVPEEKEAKKWAQHRLNELGYYGGPVGSDTEGYLKKAIIRYKFNHKDMHVAVKPYTVYDDSITETLKTALRNGDNARTWLTEPAAITDPTKTTKLMVEAITYEQGEFGGTTKAKHERDRLNRPLVPLEVKVFLWTKGKAKKVDAPQAVGPVRISWRVEDPKQDTTDQFTNTAASPSETKKYVEKALKLEGGGAGTTWSDGDNCPKKFGGTRDAKTGYKNAFLLGAHYKPYDAKDDAKQKVVFTLASDDPDKWPKRRGKAGILFRPSFVAGDSYVVQAELDFTGLKKNKAALEAAHGITDEKSRPKARTGTFVIRRFAKVALLINWPKRATPAARFGASEWAKVSTEFEKAHMDFDTASLAERTITAVLPEADYKDVVAKNTSHKDKSKISLLADSLVGVTLPVQTTQKAGDYAKLVAKFVNTDYWDKISTDLRRKLSHALRPTWPSGFVQCDFLTHKPIDIMKDPAAGDTSFAVTGAILSTFSVGLPDSMIFFDMRDRDFVYYVAAHEFGHNFWLRHYENIPKDDKGNLETQNKTDHDQADHNCIMSYTSNNVGVPAHQAPGIYAPHFCGKCNLKLRGWDGHHKDLPKDSS